MTRRPINERGDVGAVGTITPVRLRLSRARGFDLQAHSRAVNGLAAVNVARPTRWGNPFPVDCYGQDEAVDLFRRWLGGNMSSEELSHLSRCDRWSEPPSVSLWAVQRQMLNCIHELTGHNLACWCALPAPGEPDICHAAVLLEIANGPNNVVRVVEV